MLFPIGDLRFVIFLRKARMHFFFCTNGLNFRNVMVSLVLFPKNFLFSEQSNSDSKWSKKIALISISNRIAYILWIIFHILLLIKQRWFDLHWQSTTFYCLAIIVSSAAIVKENNIFFSIQIEFECTRNSNSNSKVNFYVRFTRISTSKSMARKKQTKKFHIFSSCCIFDLMYEWMIHA